MNPVGQAAQIAGVLASAASADERVLVELQPKARRTWEILSAEPCTATAARSIERLCGESVGTVDRALLLSYIEEHIDSLRPSDRAVVAELEFAVHPLAGAQLRVLARFTKLREDSLAAAKELETTW